MKNTKASLPMQGMEQNRWMYIRKMGVFMKKRAIVMSALLVIAVVIFSLGCNPPEQASSGNGSSNSSGKKAEEVQQLESTGETIEWSMFTAYGPNDGAACEVWPVLFDEIEKKTGGQLKINIYWSGQHPYEGSDMLKVIKDGEAEMVHFYSGYFTSIEPVFSIDSIPMLLPVDARDAFGALSVLWGNFEQNTSGVLEGILQEKWGATMVHLMPASPQRFFTKGYAIEGIGSLEGRKVRVYNPELATLVKILGGTPVSLSFGEVYTGLSTGLIDGLVTSLQFAESGGFLEITDNINMWEIMAAMDGAMVSLDALESLPPDVRDVFLTVMRNSAQKPEMKELVNNALILEKQLLMGQNAYVPEKSERDKVVEEVRKQIIEPWVESTGENARRAIKQIEEYKLNL